MYKIILPFLTLIALIGCNSTKEKAAQNGEKKILNTRPERKEEPKDSVAYAHLYPEVKNYMRKLDAAYDRAPYFFTLKDQVFFYVCKGDWTKLKEGKFKTTDGRLGIVNQNGEVLLPVEYSKLYNPDATADSYIEVEKNGKKGLYNYLTGKIIEPQFDVIFPSHLSGYIAFGKSGNDYFSITESAIENYTGEIPTYDKQKWTFDIHSEQLTLLFDSYCERYEEGDMQEPRGVVVLPSYIAQLNIMPELLDYINSAEGEYGTSATESKIVQAESFSDKLYALFISFYEEGVDGRGWQITEKSVAVVDDKNNVLSTEKLLTSMDYSYLYHCGEGCSGYQFLNGLIEVKNVVDNNEPEVPYTNMTYYTYYQINDQGIIQKLNSPRFFDFTKYTLLKEDYFKGCLLVKMNESIEVGDQSGNMWQSEHLSMDDLDLMRNEIYAEYGLIFKTEKWKKYFGAKPWYKPQYDNVDHLLSNMDKENIKLIQSVQEKMKADEKAYTNKRLINFAAAG